MNCDLPRSWNELLGSGGSATPDRETSCGGRQPIVCRAEQASAAQSCGNLFAEQFHNGGDHVERASYSIVTNGDSIACKIRYSVRAGVPAGPAKGKRPDRAQRGMRESECRTAPNDDEIGF